MKTGIRQLRARGLATVNRGQEAVEDGQMSFAEAGEEILRYTNEVGALMVQEVVDGLSEPVVENRIVAGGKEAVYDGKRNLRFIRSEEHTSELQSRLPLGCRPL